MLLFMCFLLCGCVDQFRDFRYRDWTELDKAIVFARLVKQAKVFPGAQIVEVGVADALPNFTDSVRAGKRTVLLAQSELIIIEKDFSKRKVPINGHFKKIAYQNNRFILYGSNQVTILDRDFKKIKDLQFSHSVDFVCDYGEHIVFITVNGIGYRYNQNYELLWKSPPRNAYQRNIRSIAYNATQICLLNNQYTLYYINADNGLIDKITTLDDLNAPVSLLFYDDILLASNKNTLAVRTDEKLITFELKEPVTLERLTDELVAITGKSKILIASPNSLVKGHYFTEIRGGDSCALLGSGLIVTDSNKVKIYDLNGQLVQELTQDRILCTKDHLMVCKKGRTMIYSII